MAFGFNRESVNGGLAELVGSFCAQRQLKTPESCQLYQSSQRIPFHIWQNMLQEVNKQYQQPALGLHIAKLIKPAHIGILGYLGLSCQNLGDALQRFERYHRLAYDCNDLQIHMHHQQIEISWGIAAGKPGQLVDETAIALFKNITEQLIIPHSLTLSRIEFVNPPVTQIQVYQNYFGCPVLFDSTRTRIIFPLHLLNLPVRGADQALQQLLDSQAASLLHELPEHDFFDRQLQQYITQAVHQGSIQIDDIAQKMHLSVRGLQRELSKRHYSFQQRLAQVRETLAKQYLQDTSLSLIDIALLLAYSEQSAFQRAFKQWTGQTPHHWRLQNLPAKTTTPYK
ncbi:AraC family transcriptional regulator [Alkanindiges sp. WGS2144]|uniref:AraC family transcriptional regulator n=1 Tax=Alkanindiges sp. WGS2144 TaxID=3366808 RepID=UPI0037538B8F